MTEDAARKKPDTVKAVLTAGADYLAGHGVEASRMACELLLARLLRCPRLELNLRHADRLGERYLAAMRRGIKRLAGGEPVQYVLGETDFLGHTFKTDARALIPRPETEVLTTAVLDCAALWAEPAPAVVDVGTGSGCIVISLALARPKGRFLGLDVSEDAVALARENAAAHGVGDRVRFAHAELSDVIDGATLDAIVSNPPYIPTAECERLPRHIRDHEPRLALDGGEDGLAVLGALIVDASMALKPGGFFFLEVGDGQAAAAGERLREAGFDAVSVAADLAGKERIVSARLV